MLPSANSRFPWIAIADQPRHSAENFKLEGDFYLWGQKLKVYIFVQEPFNSVS